MCVSSQLASLIFLGWAGRTLVPLWSRVFRYSQQLPIGGGGDEEEEEKEEEVSARSSFASFLRVGRREGEFGGVTNMIVFCESIDLVSKSDVYE